MFFDKENSQDIYATDIIYHENKRLDLYLGKPVYFWSLIDNDYSMTADTYQKIDWNNSALIESYLSHSSGDITIEYEYLYNIRICGVSYTSSGSATDRITFSIFKNDARESNSTIFIEDAAVKSSSFNINYTTKLKVNDVIDFRVKTTSNPDLTIKAFIEINKITL